ncbi:hypothetical protein Efla_001475 [Eimeria flavescens]
MKAATPRARPKAGQRAVSVRTPRRGLQQHGSSPWQNAGARRSESSSAGDHVRISPNPPTEANGAEENRWSSADEDETGFKVAVRARPLSAREQLESTAPCCLFDDGGRRVSVNAPQGRIYEFDRVFPPESTQDDIYRCISPLLRAAVNGFNAALLAYGQTGAGKTYTLGFEGAPFEGSFETLGAQKTDGILPRACREVFCLIEEKAKKHTAHGEKLDIQVSCSFLELYNEEIRDLLGASQPLRSLTIRRDAVSGQVTVQDLRSVACGSARDLLVCLHQGSQRRKTCATAQNNASSRSHAIFSIFLKQQISSVTPSSQGGSQKEKTAGSSDSLPAVDVSSRVVFSLLQFADLAGSERGKKSGTGGQRLAEGIAINSGLLALANVIRALTQQQKRKTLQQQQPQQQQLRQLHVPYRDSKLTRLLEPVLGGNSKAIMIACVSPAGRDLSETAQTLDYAARARLIRNNPTINTKPTGDIIECLKAEILKLKRLLSAKETAESEPRPDASIGEDTPQDCRHDLPRESSVVSTEEDKEDLLLLQKLNRLTEEAASLRRHVQVLEEQLHLQQTCQQAMQERFKKEASFSFFCELVLCSSQRVLQVALLSYPESTTKKLLHGPHSASLHDAPSFTSSSKEREQEQQLLHLQQEHVLLLREKQLLQRERQLRKEVLLQRQLQLQCHSEAQQQLQQKPPSQEQASQVPFVQQAQHNPQMKPLHENCQLQQQQHPTSCSTRGLEVGKPHDELVESNEYEKNPRKQRADGQQEVQPKIVSSPHLTCARQEGQELLSAVEEGSVASPAKKRQKKARRPAVLFSVIEQAHETPIKKACFLPLGASPFDGWEASQSCSLLTISDAALKMWDLTRMAARWKYTTKERCGSSCTEPVASIWGLATALGGSLVLTGLGGCIQSFDVRAQKPQRRDAWACKGGAPHQLVVGGRGLGETEMFVSSLDGFVRFYDVRKPGCNSCMAEINCGPVADICCLPTDVPNSSSLASPPHCAIVASSPHQAPRIYFRGFWTSLKGPCCSAVAVLDGSSTAGHWGPLEVGQSTKRESLVAALSEQAQTLTVWRLPASVSALTSSDGGSWSASTPPALDPAATTAGVSATDGRAVYLTSLAAWEARRCFVTANMWVTRPKDTYLFCRIAFPSHQRKPSCLTPQFLQTVSGWTGDIHFWGCGSGCRMAEPQDEARTYLGSASSFSLYCSSRMPRRLRAGSSPLTALVTGGSELLLAASPDCSLRLFRLLGGF